MAEDTRQLIEQRLAELPEDVRDAVLSAELGKHIQAIGQAHNLHVDQIGKLEDETMLVMLGFFDPEQFNAQLEQQLLIPAADAAAIAGDVNTAVFMPIRESLKRFMEEKRAEAAAPATAPAPNSTPAPAMPAAQPAITIETPPTPVPIRVVPQTTIQTSTPAVPVVQTPPHVSIQSSVTPPLPIVVPPVSAAPKPAAAPAPELHAAETMLTQPTTVKPAYKTDPYREPIE
jgi:hypothetical protein